MSDLYAPATVAGLDMTASGLRGIHLRSCLALGGSLGDVFWWRLPQIVAVAVPLSHPLGKGVARVRPWGAATEAAIPALSWACEDEAVLALADAGGRVGSGWCYSTTGELNGEPLAVCVWEAEGDFAGGVVDVCELALQWEGDDLRITAGSGSGAWHPEPWLFSAAVPHPYSVASWQRWMAIVKGR